MREGGISAVFAEDRIDGPARWTIERDVHLLMLHASGRYAGLETWLDGRRTSLGDPLPGEIWFAPAGRRYTGCARGGRVGYVAVEIPPSLLALPARAQTLAGHRDRALAALVRALAAGDAAAQDALLALLMETLDRADANPLPPPAVARRLDALLAFIDAHLETPLTVAAMAAEAGMSANSLIAHFARATGRTPAQYLLSQRVRRACCYLLHSPLSIAEIAFATGFSSHAHLCAAFRARLGASPTEWRRTIRGEMRH